MARNVTFRGNSLTLLDKEVKVGYKEQDFIVLNSNLKEVRLKDFQVKIKLISVTPSLDTPVCDIQARSFNEAAAKLPDDVVIINISVDLPLAITRFCTSAGVDRVKVLSDHRDASFGNTYGALIKELRLPARSVFIIDRD